LESVYDWLIVRVIGGEMALRVGPDVSFDNMQDWKGMREETGEFNSTKAYLTNETSEGRCAATYRPEMATEMGVLSTSAGTSGTDERITETTTT
jgi:hypothetical protein